MTAAEAFREIIMRWRSEVDGEPQLDRLGEITMNALDEAEARGRKAGLEEAAAMLVKRGRAYAEDSVLRHPGVILESFAIQVLALIPASALDETSKTAR